MKALEGLTVDDMEVFVPAFFSRLYVKAFVYGNVSATVLLCIFHAITLTWRGEIEGKGVRD